MKRIERESYVLLESGKDNAKDIALAVDKDLQEFRVSNLVIDLLAHRDLTLEDLLAFLPISDKHRSKKNSFVLVNNSINIDEVPEELLVVPTIHEAEDLIQMEEIERELGF